MESLKILLKNNRIVEKIAKTQDRVSQHSKYQLVSVSYVYKNQLVVSYRGVSYKKELRVYTKKIYKATIIEGATIISSREIIQGYYDLKLATFIQQGAVHKRRQQCLVGGEVKIWTKIVDINCRHEGVGVKKQGKMPTSFMYSPQVRVGSIGN